MSKKKTNKQKRLAGQSAGTKLVRPVRPFSGTGTMCIDLNVTAQIKEDSP